MDQSKLDSAAAVVDEEKWDEGKVDPDVQQIELANLQPKTVYVVRVHAINKVAPSLPSPDLYIKTREFGADVLQSGVNAGAIVAIVIIVVLIFVLLVDVACYYVNQCGLLMCLCVSCFGKASPEMKAKQIDTEQGKVMTEDKKPLHDLEDVRGDQGEDAPMITKCKKLRYAKCMSQSPSKRKNGNVEKRYAGLAIL
uniref:Fibronectin type-III domain-containing protein n=1 Tax=Romanomermis culicivorax TaxID=13658 RepID=A0A915HR02_ROMCU